MKKILVLSVLALGTGLVSVASAQEYGRVLSSTAVVQQVTVPRQVCSTQQVATQSAPSGAGALLGAIAGGVLGNAVGGGTGRAVATGLGVVGGAIVGNNIQGPGGTQYQTVQNCGTQNVYENRTVGYNVVYEYAGKQYNVQLPQDPGPTIPLQVSPAVQSMPVNQQPVMQTEGVYAPPVIAPVQAPVGWYQATPYARPYVMPIGVSLNLGYSNYGGHGHWR
jgi:uncharacterized protein YcfJ